MKQRETTWGAIVLVAALGPACEDRRPIQEDPAAVGAPGGEARGDGGAPPDASTDASEGTPAQAHGDGLRTMHGLTPDPAPEIGWPHDPMPAPAVVYDELRHKVTVFPGAGFEFPPAVDRPYSVWDWDGDAWTDRTPLAPAPTPGAVWMQAAAFDRARGVVVLFGGGTGPQVSPLADTWEWDGGAFTFARPQPAVAPPARSLTVMAYDPRRRVTVLFGGHVAAGPGDDLWEWDGTSWTDRTPSPRPAAWPTGRLAPTLVWDGARHRMLLFGGAGGAGHSAELWSWDGAAWADLTPRPLPSAWPAGREEHVAAFDRRRGLMLVFGGATSEGGGWPLSYLQDLWAWDTRRERFRNITPDDAAELPVAAWPLPTSLAGATFDIQRDRLVIYGGETKAAGAIGIDHPSRLYEYGR